MSKQAKTGLEITSEGMAPESPDYTDIAALAHQLWENRGCPDGSPDEDWFEAEKELKGRTAPNAVAA